MSEKDNKNQSVEEQLDEKLEEIKNAANQEAAEAEQNETEQPTVDAGQVFEDMTEEDRQIAELEAALEAARQEAADNKDLALRTKAEAENIRRRAENDVVSARKYAIEKFAGELLAVVDSIEQGLQLKAENDESKAIQDGMELTLKMMLSTLEKFGVEQLNPLEEVFDPQLHEAMTMVPSPDHESNTVIDVFQKGYTLNGRLIRPARVVVAQ
ncbi:nucleotide exchange factor GrpE [Kangiella aquimarina]|uniref:Protein GrpE n=1 Tax=Kangiella aquimarina TaxID=261965 RepID=A0ABZ0X629_9GAMM|nr:nucleotide exchange factor GrpE [Kangiella aquimarina]WQG85856.1 nucleotide exchange factor GrpE [Kangiella aquimarina]